MVDQRSHTLGIPCFDSSTCLTWVVASQIAQAARQRQSLRRSGPVRCCQGDDCVGMLPSSSLRVPGLCLAAMERAAREHPRLARRRGMLLIALLSGEGVRSPMQQPVCTKPALQAMRQGAQRHAIAAVVPSLRCSHAALAFRPARAFATPRPPPARPTAHQSAACVGLPSACTACTARRATQQCRSHGGKPCSHGGKP